MVTWENYEEYILLLADGELNEPQKQSLMDFISVHPELEQELRAFLSAVMIPEPEIGFSGKETLLREEPVHPSFSLRQWWLYGAAASLLGLILWLGLSPISRQAERPVAVWKPEPEKQSAIKESVLEENKEEPEAAVSPKQNLTGIAPAKKKTKAKTEKAFSIPEPETIAFIKGVEPIFKPVIEKPAVPEKQEIMPETFAAKTEETMQIHLPDKAGWIVSMFLGEEKKQGFKALKNNLEQKIEDVKTVQKEIKNTEFALQIGKKEVFTIKF